MKSAERVTHQRKKQMPGGTERHDVSRSARGSNPLLGGLQRRVSHPSFFRKRNA